MPQRTAWTLAAAASAVLAGAAPARADELQATLDQPLEEVSHTVEVRIADGVATYTVQRQFRNRGKVADEARLAIDLPSGAAATGLRIRASGTWHTGELLDRAQAAERYRELTGAGVYDPKDPALLFWVSPSELFLQVFPVLPNTVSTVEYTLTVPTRYAAGRYWLTYPRVDRRAATAQPVGLKLADPVLTVAATAGLGPITVDGKAAEAGRPVTLSPRPAEPWLGAEAVEGTGNRGTSVIDVPASPRTAGTVSAAKLSVDLQHGSPSDVRLELVTPAGERVTVADDASGSTPRAAFDVQLPTPARGAGRWRLVAWNSSTTQTGTLGRWALTLGGQTFTAADTPVLIPTATTPNAALAAITVVPPPAAPWTGRLGRVVASTAHAFSRLEVDAAPRLSAVPKQAQVVFVLDASYSAGAPLVAAQLAILRAYLAHVPDAELEVIAVRRAAKRVFGRFVPARDAGRLLDDAVRGGALALGNGSALDEGARLAASILAGRPGPQRVVLATDELLRSSLTDTAALAALAQLAPAAVVHVVIPDASSAVTARASLARDDTAALAPLATRHHGILARVAGLPAQPAELAPVVLELVRPTRIDHLAATGNVTVDATLAEGEGLRIFEGGRTADEAPAKVTLTGALWSDPIRLEVAASAPFSTAAAAFVFGADLHGGLSEAEQKTVAYAGRAVSPVTSYLAIEPGVRPSKIGLDHGGTGWGLIGSGRYGTLGHGGGGGSRPVADLRSMIETGPCLRKHPPAGPWSVELEVETTKDEIVDVAVRGGAGPLAACLAEAAWAVRLDDRFDQHRETFAVELSGR